MPRQFIFQRSLVLSCCLLVTFLSGHVTAQLPDGFVLPTGAFPAPTEASDAEESDLPLFVGGIPLAEEDETTPFPTTPEGIPVRTLPPTTFSTPAPSTAAMPSDFPSLSPSLPPSDISVESDTPSLTPSEAPTGGSLVTAPPSTAPTPQAQFPACTICPEEDEEITEIDAEFADPFFGNVTSCGDAEMRAGAGYYNPDQCVLLQEELNNFCGCALVASTGTPTGSPVAGVTPSPVTASPTPGATVAPTKAPTNDEEATDLVGFVYVTLLYVASTMPESIIPEYETACAQFLEEALSSMSPPISGLSVELLQQNTWPLERRRQLLRSDSAGRSLQSDLPPLWTLLRVKGQSAGSVEDFNGILLEAVQLDPQGLLRVLRGIGGDAEIYFGNVRFIQAYDPEEPLPTAPPETSAPPPEEEEDGDGLGTTGIVAIVIGAAVAVAVGAAGYSFLKRDDQRSIVGAASPSVGSGGSTQKASAAAVGQKLDKADIPAGVSSTYSMPSALAAPSAADSSVAQSSAPPTITGDSMHDANTTQGAPSIMASSDVGDMSYTYSLDAGNVDQRTLSSAEGQTGAGFSTIGDQSTEYTARPNLFSRRVLAPPGKLGIVIDTTLEGPVVHKVNPGSALEGKLSPGDIIVAIDDVDTRAMSASGITELMIKTAHQERQLTVLSEGDVMEA